FCSSRRRHTRSKRDWSSDVCSSDLGEEALYYARIRATDSDFGRTGRQRQVVEAMLARFKQLGITEMSTVAFDYLPYVTTNLSDKIGRASCRERVEDTEVEVRLKKQT